MERERESQIPEEYELDWQAWNLPRPVKQPQPQKSSSSVQSEHEDKSETETESA